MNEQPTDRNSSAIEHCWTLVGKRQGSVWFGQRIQPTTGEPTTVDFDGQWVLAREEGEGDIIGFYHTHPGGSPDPSARDLKTMRAWVGSFGKPLLCLIEADGQIAAFRFDDDECDGVKLKLCELFPEDIVVACD